MLHVDDKCGRLEWRTAQYHTNEQRAPFKTLEINNHVNVSYMRSLKRGKNVKNQVVTSGNLGQCVGGSQRCEISKTKNVAELSV